MTAPAITAPYLAEVVLLGTAGLAKIARPDTTVRALHVARIPASRNAVRAGAACELAVALAALALPGAMTGAIVALSYAAFTVFVAGALRRRWPLSSCGCFGKPDSPPTITHAALNAGAVLCGVWWSASGPRSLASVFSGQPWQGVPLALVTVVVILLAYVVWTNPLPTARRLVRDGWSGQ
ncbi:MAG TPA: MauE/DoxX family redox-associated membrane protein [Acidimicrobiales bacterium]